MPVIPVFPMDVQPVVDWTTTGAANIANNLDSVSIIVDRTNLSGPVTGDLFEVEIDLSIDGGATFPGGVYVDAANQRQYSLRYGFTIPDGVLTNRDGSTMTNQVAATVWLPPVTNRRVRARYRILLARTWALSIETLRRAN